MNDAPLVPDVMITVTVCTDGSFFAVAQRMTQSGESTENVEHGESKQELLEWLDGQVHQPVRH